MPTRFSQRPALHGDSGASPDSSIDPLNPMAAREGRFWLLGLFLLVSLVLGLALVSWRPLRSLAWKLEALPIALVFLVALLGVYAISRWREMAQLRALMRTLSLATQAPSATQVEQLFTIVQRSQRGYRDLIDTFEDVLLSLSLDGEIVAANRSFAHLLGRSFKELVGRRLDEFVEVADGSGLAQARRQMPFFLERRHWSGVLRLRFKQGGSLRYFHCAIHALVREGAPQGICILARDITKEREDEARFTDLFETLQEGVYLADSEGKLEDVNPAFVAMLGYENRSELVGRPLSEFFLRPEDWQAERRHLAQSDILPGHEAMFRRRDGS